MFGVLISHFGLVLDRDQTAIADVLYLIGKFASPTFMLVSGIMLGFLLAHARNDTARLKVHLLDRALFLLVIGHPLIAVALYHRGLPLSQQWIHSFMTDTIALCIIFGILVTPRLSKHQRLLGALALYALSWVAVIAWLPHDLGARIVKEFVVGTIEVQDPYAQTIFSIMPWAAVYFAGTVIGEGLPDLRVGGVRETGRRFLLGGALAVVTGLGVKAAYLVVRPVAWRAIAEMPRTWYVAYNLTSLFDKYPPGPAYLLFYGGLGAVLIGCCLVAVERNLFPAARSAAATVGRASLIVFVLSYYVLYLGVARFPLEQTAWLPWLFLASAILLWAVAWGWNRWAGNRFLTVGLRRVLTRWRVRKGVPTPFD